MKYSRLDRKKNPPAIEICTKGSMIDLFDNAIKETFIITDDEYDILAEHMAEEDSNLLFVETLTYKEAKQLLLSINKHLDS